MGFLDKLFGTGQTTSQTGPSASNKSADQALRIYADGMVLFASGQKREGLAKFTEALRVDPTCVAANLALASAFCAIDPLTHAEHILHCTATVLAKDPGNSKARHLASATHFALGKSAWDAEKWPQATASFQSAYEMAPGADHTAEALAFCAEQAGALPSVIPAFEHALTTDPTDSRARYLAGRSYIKLAMEGDSGGSTVPTREDALQRGERHLRAVLEGSPRHADANYWLGGAYLMAGRDTEAQEIIDLLRSVDPEKCAELEELRS